MAIDWLSQRDPDTPTRDLAELSYVAPIAILLETLITYAIVTLGPKPVLAESSQLLPPGMALLEPRDRMVLAGWFLSIPVLLGSAWLLARLPRTKGRLVGETLLLIGAVVLAGASALSFKQEDPALAIWIPRLHAWELAIGVITALLAVGILVARSNSLRRVGSAVLVLVTLSFLLPALVQTPTTILEPWHAAYTLDEMIAPAAGQVPLVDYFPQYVNLLGLPIAPLVQSWPDHALAIALGWIVILQVITILGVVLVGAMVGGWRAVPLVLLVVSALVIFPTAAGWYTASYFAALPYRTVLPVVTIVAALALFGRRAPLGSRSIMWRAAVVGALAGVAALNNPDHGLPVVAAVGGGILLALTGARERVAAATVGGCSVVLPFLLYTTVTGLTGEAAHWSAFLLFPRMFGTTGYGNIPMPAFGTHVGVVAFFSAATVIGIILLLRRKDSDSWRTQGLALTICGGWSLLTLTYYVGRSLPPQLLFGSAIQVGMVSAALLPLGLRAVRRLRSGQISVTAAGAASMTLTALALGAIAGSLLSAPTPAASLRRIDVPDAAAPWNLSHDTPAVEAAMQGPAAGELRRLMAQGRLGQVVGSSSLVELITGVPSVSVANNPQNLTVTRGMLRLQCEEIADRALGAVIMPTWVAANLNAVAACRHAVEVEDHQQVAEGLVLVRALRRDG